MAGFVGSAVIVTLKQGAVIQGFVQTVDPTSASLVLQDAFLPNTGQRLGSFTAQGPAIADLRVLDTPPPAPSAQRHSTASTITPQNAYNQAPPQSHPPPQPEPEQFEDPAILSFSRRPTSINNAPPPQQAPVVAQAPAQKAPPSSYAAAAGAIPSGPRPAALKETQSTKNVGKQRAQQPHRAATIQGAFAKLDMNAKAAAEPFSETDNPPASATTIRKVSITKTRTGKPMDDDAPNGEGLKKKGKKKRRDAPPAAGEENVNPAENSLDARRGVSAQYRGKGWRETPILQEQPVPSSPRKANASNKGSVRRSRKEREAANNGWATEDATDIQEMGEFDFVGNLSKFDKRSVFDQIRTEDTTADEDRLVFSNKARPGTYGGKNYHPTENVLDSPKVAPRLSNHETDSDDFDENSGRAARRINSRASSRRPHRVGSGALDDTASLKKQALRPHYAGSSSHGAGGSPNPQRYTPPESPAGSQTLGHHFRIATTNRACPTIMPAGMAAIEEVAETEFGLTTEIMTENAGRGIAEVAMATISNTASRRGSARDGASRDTRPWALIIAGNHKSGARALAACRHLRSRNIRTLTCVLGFDRQTVELEREVRKQADILVKMGGYVRGWTETKNYIAREGQPDLVIDAVMAASKPFDVLSLEDQKSVVEIVGWTKRASGKGVTLSVDMPCGINGSTGEPSPIDPTTALSLQIPTNHIVCIGAPRIGLLRALQKTAIHKAALSASTTPPFSLDLLNAQIWVVDIGVEKAWKRSGLAGSRGVKFGTDWVVPVKLVEGLAEDR